MLHAYKNLMQQPQNQRRFLNCHSSRPLTQWPLKPNQPPPPPTTQRKPWTCSPTFNQRIRLRIQQDDFDPNSGHKLIRCATTCMHACMHVCMYVCMYTYIYIYCFRKVTRRQGLACETNSYINQSTRHTTQDYARQGRNADQDDQEVPRALRNSI